ncbi:hypothetical protein PGT21_007929 [Puccinia graminis f. sp. tritici]|uniref:Uncharacterized protein n=1 Tax=Puccinia graminis f. sp. tritici TaxID=56615 RepID=A0A5B0MBI4_PUCGR|nr:hypothetical protein PGT21_007929 [Puccinia graminis f. sp. tritici]
MFFTKTLVSLQILCYYSVLALPILHPKPLLKRSEDIFSNAYHPSTIINNGGISSNIESPENFGKPNWTGKIKKHEEKINGKPVEISKDQKSEFSTSSGETRNFDAAQALFLVNSFDSNQLGMIIGLLPEDQWLCFQKLYQIVLDLIEAPDGEKIKIQYSDKDEAIAQEGMELFWNILNEQQKACLSNLAQKYRTNAS